MKFAVYLSGILGSVLIPSLLVQGLRQGAVARFGSQLFRFAGLLLDVVLVKYPLHWFVEQVFLLESCENIHANSSCHMLMHRKPKDSVVQPTMDLFLDLEGNEQSLQAGSDRR